MIFFSASIFDFVIFYQTDFRPIIKDSVCTLINFSFICLFRIWGRSFLGRKKIKDIFVKNNIVYISLALEIDNLLQQIFLDYDCFSCLVDRSIKYIVLDTNYLTSPFGEFQNNRCIKDLNNLRQSRNVCSLQFRKADLFTYVSI